MFYCIVPLVIEIYSIDRNMDTDFAFWAKPHMMGIYTKQIKIEEIDHYCMPYLATQHPIHVIWLPTIFGMGVGQAGLGKFASMGQTQLERICFFFFIFFIFEVHSFIKKRQIY